VCASCYEHPVRRCGRCGRTRRVSVRATATTPDLCPTCHQAPVLTCALCSTTTLCRTTLRGPDGSRQPICFRCQLARRLDTLLADTDVDGNDGTIPEALLGLRAAILATDNPRTPLGWLSRGPAPRLLAAIAAGTLPLTHASLDTAAGLTGPGSHCVEHLRQLLVVTGALPDRDRQLPRLQRRLTQMIDALPDTLPATDRQTLTTYATWHQLRRLRSRASAGHDNTHAVHGARDAVAEASTFTVWLHHRGRTLADFTQTDLDTYFADHRTRRASPISTTPRDLRRLPAFLRWAAARNALPRNLSIPDTPPRQPTVFLTDTERREHITRLQDDDTLHVADRVAGLLVLLYAQPLARIVRLTRHDVRHHETGVELTLGRTALQLPPALAKLVVQLPAEHPGGVAHHLAAGDPWLFPGRRPGQHLHPLSLTHRLTSLGIHARAGRNTALLDLAATVPAVAIADLLAITPATAEHWNALSGHRWTTYAARQ